MLVRLSLLLIFILAFLLLTRVDQLTDNVYTLNLHGGSYLDYHASIQAIALVCPGVHYMRLWPSPVRRPWPDPTDRREGPAWYARRIDPQAEVD